MLVVFYRQLSIGRKYTRFGVKYPKLLVGLHLPKYKEMFLETLTYIRYDVITIVIFTSMLAIELFYPTQLRSFLGCFFEYLPLFLPYRFAVYPLQYSRSSGRYGHIPSLIRRQKVPITSGKSVG